MSNRLVAVQLDASAWGVRQVLEACRDLTPEQFNREHDIGPPPGSLQGTLAHIIEAMFYFADNFAGREYVEPPHFAAMQSTTAGLSQLLGEAEAAMRTSIEEFLRAARDDVDALVHWSGIKRDIPASIALAQVFDHATHHRVQCMHMLKRLGVTPLPEAYPLAFTSGPEGSGP